MSKKLKETAVKQSSAGLAVLSAFGLLAQGNAWAVQVGTVITLQPGVVAVRGGETIPLELKSPIHDTDVLVSDANGRLQVLFDDHSTVSISSNTTLELQTVIPGGDEPEFKANLGQGLARFITGGIVKKNPDGFNVTAPEATIGIRGTIFSVASADGLSSTVYVDSAEQGTVFVAGQEVPPGFKITLPDMAVAPMTPEDRQMVQEQVQAYHDRGEDAPLVVVESGTTGDMSDIMYAANEVSLTNQVLTSNSATASGALQTQNGSGSFSFRIDNLSTGQISGATITRSSGGGSGFNYALVGGSGWLTGSSAGVSGFSSTGSPNYFNGTAPDPNLTFLDANMAFSTVTESVVSGSFGASFRGVNQSGGATHFDTGSFSGNIVPQ